jgi:hypothetical protein
MTLTKQFIFITLAVINAGFSLTSCNSKTSKNSETGEVKAITEVTRPEKVTAYYFHATRRCATCEAVEKVTKASLKEYYGSDVPFISINRDEDKNEAIINHYKVNAQTLLIVKNDKMINLTNDAFLNARTNPDKLKAKIKETIDALL